MPLVSHKHTASSHRVLKSGGGENVCIFWVVSSEALMFRFSSTRIECRWDEPKIETFLLPPMWLLCIDQTLSYGRFLSRIFGDEPNVFLRKFFTSVRACCVRVCVCVYFGGGGLLPFLFSNLLLSLHNGVARVESRGMEPRAIGPSHCSTALTLPCVDVSMT